MSESDGTKEKPPDIEMSGENDDINTQNDDLNTQNTENQTNIAAEKTENNNTNTNIPTVNLYNTDTVSSLYKVDIEKTDGSPISSLRVGEMISKLISKEKISSLKRINRKKVVVYLRDVNVANEMVNNAELKKVGLKAYIPWFYTCRDAVIRDVDVEYDETTLLNNIDARQFRVTRVQRLKRKIVENGKSVLIPTRSVKVTFEGEQIPQYVFLWYNRIPCEPFIRQVRQCLSCLRFGHVAQACKGDEKCFNCGDVNHKSADCSLDEKCANCRRPHLSTDNQCPERIRQQNINEIMGLRNLSFHEANEASPRNYLDQTQFSVVTSNKFNSLQNYDVDFPVTYTENEDLISTYTPPLSLGKASAGKPKKKYKTYLKTKQHDLPLATQLTETEETEPITQDKTRPETAKTGPETSEIKSNDQHNEQTTIKPLTNTYVSNKRYNDEEENNDIPQFDFNEFKPRRSKRIKNKQIS